MSIGKSSIARAVSSTNTVKAQNTTNTNIITSFLVDNIGTLTIAKEPNKIEEININTMESLKIKNLYIIGELLDVDGLCGGYNLTFAFISGIIAGSSC